MQARKFHWQRYVGCSQPPKQDKSGRPNQASRLPPQHNIDGLFRTMCHRRSALILRRPMNRFHGGQVPSLDSPKIEIGILEFANQHHHPSGRFNRYQSLGGIFKAACRPVKHNAGAKNRNRVSKHFSPLRCVLQVVNCESYFFCRP